MFIYARDVYIHCIGQSCTNPVTFHVIIHLTSGNSSYLSPHFTLISVQSIVPLLLITLNVPS